MELLLFRIAALLVGSGLGAVHDAKTGLISDKITYAMIALGIIFNIVELDWQALALSAGSFDFVGIFFGLSGLFLGAIVFAVFYAIYYFGKIGGGDVKLFAGIAFLMPFFSGKIFLLGVLFFSAIFAVVFYSVFYTIKYARRGIDWKENSQGIGKGVLFAILFLAYFIFLWQAEIVPVFTAGLFCLPFMLGCVFLAFERGIRKNFFLKKIPLQKLEEDEVVAMDFLDEKTKRILAVKAKGIIGEKEKARLEKAGIKEILVYRGMPPFGPFIFLAIIVVLTNPQFGMLFI